jgi:UDP-N-acetylmuramoylalanine--D-glutamate ligase
VINLAKYAGAKVGVFGLGKTGLESIAALSAHGATIYAWDDSESKVLEAKSIIQNENVIFADIINADIKDLDFVLVSPGIPHKFPAPHKIFTHCQRHNIPTKTDIELLFEACPYANYIGVTGTNGKSTTVSLIQHVLSSNCYHSALGGNIGIPALGLPNISKASESYVLELSSYQLESLNSSQFNIAVLLSITPDHLDRYESLNAYVAAKFKIFQNQGKDDCAIISLNVEQNKCLYDDLRAKSAQNIIPISSNMLLDSGISILGNELHDNYFAHKTFPLSLPKSLLGRHNAENIATTYAVAKILGLATKEILLAINSFVGLPHRMEVVWQNEQLLFINDSKATNIAAASQALDSYEEIYWIAGGIFKEANILALDAHLKNVKHCYLVGKDAKKFVTLLEQNQIPYTISGNIENALIEIKNTVSKGVVLLSPACASFDQWKNFEERGDAFKRLVLD